MKDHTDTFDTAQRFVSGQHNDLVRLRDQVGLAKREALGEGRILDALGHEMEIARLEGRIDGLTTATTQLQMVRERVEA